MDSAVTLPFVGLACPQKVKQFERWELARFLRLQKIGSGFASNVYLCLDTLTNRRFALKTYRKATLNEAVREAVYKEIAIHGRIRHPHVLGLYAAFEDSGYICILLGLAQDSDLYRRLPEVRRDERAIVKYIVGPLLSAVAALHLQGIMHRDLKPENILLQGHHLLLADFGFAVSTLHHRPLTRLGTLHFMAPEVLLNDPAEGRTMREHVPRVVRLPYDAAADVWAVGVIAYEVLFRRAPFDGDSDEAVINDILAASPEYDAGVSPDARDFLLSCLSYDARFRPTAAELYHHPWIQAHMAPDTWESLLPENFVATEGACSGGETDAPISGRADAWGRQGDQAPGDLPTRHFRKHAGSLGLQSEDGYDADHNNDLRRRRANAIHSQTGVVKAPASVAGSRAGSLTGFQPGAWEVSSPRQIALGSSRDWRARGLGSPMSRVRQSMDIVSGRHPRAGRDNSGRTASFTRGQRSMDVTPGATSRGIPSLRSHIAAMAGAPAGAGLAGAGGTISADSGIAVGMEPSGGGNGTGQGAAGLGDVVGTVEEEGAAEDRLEREQEDGKWVAARTRKKSREKTVLFGSSADASGGAGAGGRQVTSKRVAARELGKLRRLFQCFKGSSQVVVHP